MLRADPAGPSPGRRSPGTSPPVPRGTRGTAMNTNDAKEYLARREIPQLFEVGGQGWQTAGRIRGRHVRALGGGGNGSRARSHLADTGHGSEEACRSSLSRLPGVVALPAGCRGPCPVAGLRSPHLADQVSVFQGSRLPPPYPSDVEGGLPASVGPAF